MKIIIALLASFYLLYPPQGVSESSNDLIGKWKLIDVRCEDNRVLSKTEKWKAEAILESQGTLEVQANGTMIETKRHPEGCLLEVTYPYSISDMKILHHHIKEALPGKVECQDNPEFESPLEKAFRKSIEILSKIYGEEMFDQEFKALNNKVFFYNKLNSKFNILDCSPSRNTFVYERIE